jgi:hypothetical protein
VSGRSYCLVSALVFTVVSLAHLWRAAVGATVLIDGWPAPNAISWLAVVGAGALAVWGYRQAARRAA